MGHQDSSVLEGWKMSEWSVKSASASMKSKDVKLRGHYKIPNENYRGLNGTIVIDALRSDQIVDMYLRQRRKVVLDWMLELLNPTS